MLPWALVLIVFALIAAPLGIAGLSAAGLGTVQFLIATIAILLAVSLFATFAKRAG